MNRGTPSRLIGPELAYAVLFAAQGILIPFMPAWLTSHGVDPTLLGTVLAATYMGKIFANPFFANATDRSGVPLATIRFLALGGAAIYTVLWLFGSAWTAVALVLSASLMVPALYPLTDRYAVLMQESGLRFYGRLRLWGSIGFAIATCTAGPLIDCVGIGWLPLGVATLFAGVALLTTRLPDLRSRPMVGRRPALSKVIEHKRLLVFLIAAALVQSSNAFYYGYGTIYWKAEGHNVAFISATWFIGIGSEIVMFFLAEKLLRRFGPERILVVSALATALRWAILASGSAPGMVLTSQTLQGFTIAGNSAAILSVISRHAPEDAKTSFIALFQTLGMGPFIAANAAFLGFWYGREGMNGFLPMAVVAAFACAISLTAAAMSKGTDVELERIG